MSVAKWFLVSLLLSSNTLLGQVRDTSLVLYFLPDVFVLDSIQVKQIEEFALGVSGISKVTGYADSIGTVEYNLKLSMQRANSVAQILKNKVQHKLIDYKGEAFARSSELSKNRAVEINAFVARDSIVDIFDINNIMFVPDKPIITPESLQNTQVLVSRMKRYKKSCFELIGHVNYESKRSSTMLKSMFELSEQRAMVIKDLLVQHGIEANRIRARGVGNTQPIYPEPANDEERKQNMRVQVIVYNCSFEYLPDSTKPRSPIATP